MSNSQAFIDAVQKGYQFKGKHVKIGCGMFNGEVNKEASVFIPLKTMNRHGLIAGATGTGKTKTLQLISECLSDNSVPVLLMDIKGDLSGIAAEGVSNEKVIERSAKLGIQWKPTAYPVELLTLTGGNGFTH